jgi:hypothetical protein
MSWEGSTWEIPFYEESLAVAIVEEDVLASVAARGQMIQRATVFDAQRLGHGATLEEDR